MTNHNPIPPDAGRTYSDAEIKRILESWMRYRASANPKDWYVATDIAEAIIRQLRAERDTARAEIAIDDKLLAERNRILEALPCPVHGPCVPYVLEFIKKHHHPQSADAEPGGRESEE